jgi:peptide/nickel transport system substrate-binding protein
MKRTSFVVVAVLAAGAVAAYPAATTPAQAPKRGGTIVVRMIGPDPACWNPLDARCAGRGPTMRWIGETVLEKAFEVDARFEYRPRLVSRVDFTTKRPFALTYRIRPRARWSDGVPVTARDFIFTLQAIRRHGTPEDRALHAPIRSARAVGAKTLRVVLRSRMAGWRELFGLVLPSHALRRADLTKVWRDGIDNPRTGRAIGSGPFLLERWERGRELVLRRNASYSGTHPAYADRLVVRFAQGPSDPTAALEKGEVDIATGVPPDVVQSVRRNRRLRVSAVPGAAFEHFDIQFGPEGHPALRSKLVRRALAYGIDRVALVREVYGGVLPVTRPLDSLMLMTQDRHYDANWSAYRYRPARARALLEQAGCRRGSDAIYSCAGERLSLRFVTSAGVPTRQRTISVVQAQLRRVGIEVVPVFAPGDAFIGQILPTRAFQVALYGWAFVPSGSWKDVYGCGGESNFTGYCQRLATADLDQADRTFDDAQRARVLNRVDRRIARDVPTIPLYQFVITAAHHAGVRGFAMPPGNPLWNAEDWWLARR